MVERVFQWRSRSISGRYACASVRALHSRTDALTVISSEKEQILEQRFLFLPAL
jgi:hypothetical protein